jgi:hypothetical protein
MTGDNFWGTYNSTKSYCWKYHVLMHPLKPSRDLVFRFYFIATLSLQYQAKRLDMRTPDQSIFQI